MDERVGFPNYLIFFPNAPLPRPGVHPVINQIRAKFRMPTAVVQVPIGVEDQVSFDLVHWKVIYSKDTKG